MSTVEDRLTRALQLLPPRGGPLAHPEPNRLDQSLTPAQLPAAAAALIGARWGHLAAITGLDHGPEAATLEVLYHFCGGPAIVTLRVSVPRGAPVAPSLAALIVSATLYEREVREMFGVEFTGSPNTDRLYLPDDWPAGEHPLRKDAVFGQPAAPAA